MKKRPTRCLLKKTSRWCGDASRGACGECVKGSRRTCVCVCVCVCLHVVAAQAGQALEDAETFGRLHRDMATELEYVRRQLEPGARMMRATLSRSRRVVASKLRRSVVRRVHSRLRRSVPASCICTFRCVVSLSRCDGELRWRPGVVSQRGRRGMPRPWHQQQPAVRYMRVWQRHVDAIAICCVARVCVGWGGGGELHGLMTWLETRHWLALCVGTSNSRCQATTKVRVCRWCSCRRSTRVIRNGGEGGVGRVGHAQMAIILRIWCVYSACGSCDLAPKGVAQVSAMWGTRRSTAKWAEAPWAPEAASSPMRCDVALWIPRRSQRSAVRVRVASDVRTGDASEGACVGHCLGST